MNDLDKYGSSGVVCTRRAFNRRLTSYAAAAGAIAAGVMGLAKSADAKVVYTATDVTITSADNESLFIDLNRDGINDFEVKAYPDSRGCGALVN